MAEKGPKNFSRFMRHFPTTGKANTILQSMHEIIRDISESIGLFLSTDRSINVNSTASLLL